MRQFQRVFFVLVKAYATKRLFCKTILIYLILLGVIFCYALNVKAELIGTMNLSFSGAHEPLDTIGVEVDGLFFQGPLPEGPALFEGVIITPSDIGQIFTATEGTDPDFDDVVDFLTNGLKDSVYLEWTYVGPSANGGGSGTGKGEPCFFGDCTGANGIDFKDYFIDSIELVVDEFEFVSHGGYLSHSCSYIINVYGTLIPAGHPIASFNASQTSSASPLTVYFFDASEGDITSWEWNFGDATTSNDQDPSHTYNNPGTYSVSLTVSGPVGSDTETQADLITVIPPITQGYIIGDLGAIDGRYVYFASDINEDGQVTGYTWPHPYTQAFLWTEQSGAVELGTLGGSYSRGRAINDNGQVAGNSDTLSNSSDNAFLWTEAGGMVDLGTLGVRRDSTATDVNDDGKTVGYSSVYEDSHAFLWTEEKGMVDLGTFGGRYSYAHGINNKGQVVGYATSPSFINGHACLWSESGVIKDLGTLGGIASIAFDINGNGKVVGRSHIDPGDFSLQHAFLWSDVNGIMDLGTLGGSYSEAQAVNNQSEIVGSSRTSSGNRHAFLWTEEGDMEDLNALLPPDSGWELIEANGISDEGQIVGFGYFNGSTRAFLMTPLPENQPPVAICQDVTVPTDSGECTATVAAVDDGSYDPDGDPITLEQTPSGAYPLGSTDVTLTVTDDKGSSDTCSATVEVVDQELPTIESLVASPDTLWPANHKIVPVSLQVQASDNCDSELSCQITSVAANELEATASDWEITGDSTVNLRAERSGTGDGRVYTITVECTDDAGNTATGTVEVFVPHDQG